MQQPKLQQVQSLIDFFSGLRYRSLLFPAALEQHFESETVKRRCMRFWLEGLLAIALFDAFLLVDRFSTPALFHRALIIRLCLITPLALAVNVGMLFQPGRRVRETTISLAAFLAGASHLWLESGRDAVSSALAQFGIVAVILFANTIMRLQFPYALSATAITLACDGLVLRSDAFLTSGQKLLAFSLTLGCTAGALIANYSFGREERLNYLLCLKGDLLVDQLSHSNRELQLIAERDKLTGLPNRHAFERRMAKVWDRACKNGTPVSVILVDVDRFKHINDTFGHLYGDRVLKRIGHLLAEALRRKDDMATRFGGEEFLLLLPETPLELATGVAERIRTLVLVAGLPALEAPSSQLSVLRATVSCGVATAIPRRSEDYQGLLKAADVALYQAKGDGRNRVCAAA
jgi:diguanylate cyclase (GGDEF)-like protein